MKFPLILAHGPELLYAVLAGFAMTYGPSILCLWLAVLKKKTAALTAGFLALGVITFFLIYTNARSYEVPPLLLSLIGLWLASRIKKEPIQSSETTRGKCP